MDPAPPSVGWRRLTPILGVHFIGTLGYSIAIPFLVYLVTDLGGAAWTYGLLGATYSLFQLLGAPLLGRWSDHSGRRRVLALSQAGTLLAWLVFLAALALPVEPLGEIAGASVTLPLLLVFGARALDGLTGGNISVANAYVADMTTDTPELRQQAFGRMGIAASLGFTTGPAVAGLLGATPLGYTAPVGLAAVVSLAATVVVVVALPEPDRRCPDGPPDNASIARTLTQQLRRCDRPVPKAEPGTLTQPRIVSLLVATFLMFLAFNVFYAAFPVHAERSLGWGAGGLGGFFTVLSGVMILAQGPILSAVAARVPAPWVFGFGMACFVGAFVALTGTSDVAVYAGAVLFAVANGLSWPTFQSQVADAAGEHQGAVQGAVTGAGSVASIVGLLLGGLAYPAVGPSLFLLIAALFVLVLLGTPVWFARVAPTR